MLLNKTNYCVNFHFEVHKFLVILVLYFCYYFYYIKKRLYFNLLPFKACKAVNQILCILNLLILITVIVFFRKDKETRQEGNDKLLFLYENNYVKQLFKTKNFRGDCYYPTSIRLLKKRSVCII